MQTGVMRRCYGGRCSHAAPVLASLAALCLAVPALATITLVSYPTDLVALDEEITVSWLEQTDCRLRYGRAPGVYTEATLRHGEGTLTFAPEWEGMASGIWYCVVAALAGGETSDEFPLVVESSVFPTPVAPPNGGIVQGTTTLLRWDPVEGVPFYHVAVSDSEIHIEEENGLTVLTGANIVWQAITGATSIRYGSVDPSGHFVESNGESPPLMSGFDYRWLILNNYGNHPLLTSLAGAGLAGFTADAPAAVAAPQLLAPQDSLSVVSDVVDFSWVPVPGAVGYRLYIYQKRTWGGGEASYPVWNGSTSMPGAQVHVASFLATGEYHWRVVALDASGAGAASELRRFDYSTETGTAHIRTVGESGAAVAAVLVEIRYASGGVTVLPAVTNSSGFADKTLAAGLYEFTATKTGYVDTTVTALIPAGAYVDVPIVVRRASARLRGSVEDEQGQPVPCAMVTAAGEAGVAECPTDLSGAFALQLEPGLWQVRAEKQGYAPCEPESVALSGGEYLELPEPLVLTGAPGTLAGNVVNAAGTPVAGATVWAEAGGALCPTVTMASGRFALQLAAGTWMVWAEKAGFQPTNERTVGIPPGATVELFPALCLNPVDASIMGRVTDGLACLAGARVLAVPVAGEEIEAMTNGWGEFVLLPPRAPYSLTASGTGFANADPCRISTENGDSYLGVEIAVVPIESTVSGAVLLGGEPAGDAVVTDGVACAVTQSDGSFSLALPRGLHEIRAGKAGCVPGERMLVATSAGQSIGGLALAVSSGAGSIRGRVRSGGLPVSGVIVSAVSGEAADEVRTGADGSYELLVEPGTWSVGAFGPGFEPSQTTAVTVAAGQTASGIDFVVESSLATLRGTVSDALGTVTAAHLLVLDESGEGVVCSSATSAAGAFLVRLESGRAYVLEASASSRGRRRVTVAPLAPGSTRTVSVALPRVAGSIEGRVTDDGGLPIVAAVVTASWGDSAVVRTDRDGRFALWLDEGLYDVRVACPGYDAAFHADVEVVEGGVHALDCVLAAAFAELEGSVSDSLTGDPLPGVLVTAVSGRRGASAVTDAAGHYRVEGVVPGHVEVSFRRPCLRPRILALDVEPRASHVVDVRMIVLSGTIGGRVTGHDGAGVPGASVRARLGAIAAGEARTDGDGRYLLTGLDENELFSVSAWREGFYAGSENPVAGIPAAAEGVDFVLLPADATISGTVVDAQSLAPLVGAVVTADNGLGHCGSAVSGADGWFCVGSLAPVGSYSVSAGLYGYHEAGADGVLPGAEGIRFELPRNFAVVSGTLAASGSDVPLSECVVVATCTSFAGDGRAVAPDLAGAYEIADLAPGPYVVTVSAPGCVVTPTQIQIELAEGAVEQGLDFVLERAAVARVEIGGPTDIESGSEVTFSGDALTETGRLVETDLIWGASPEVAGSMDAETGRFVSDAGYVGEVTVRATEPLSGSAGALDASTFGRLSPSSESCFRDSAGMAIRVPSGAVAEARFVHLAHEELPDVRRYARGFEIRGPAYHLKPDGLTFVEGREPTLSLPFPEPAEIAVWSGSLLRWESLGGEEAGGCIEAPIASLGEFAALTESEPLAVSGLAASPNPFSPDAGPVTISYELSSDEARMPFVTVTLYNMVAQKVRELVENEPQGKGRQTVGWDGLTDDGDEARNGRYVVEVTAEDSSGKASARGTLVLVK